MAFERRLRRQTPMNVEWQMSVTAPRVFAVDPETGEEPSKPPRIPPGWNTDRSWSVTHDVVGWMPDGYDNPRLLEKRLRKQKPRNLEWANDLQYPLALPYKVHMRGYWEDGENVPEEQMTPMMQRAHRRRLDRQRTFLAEIARGITIGNAAQLIGVSVRTVTAWRRRYPSFRTSMDRARAGYAPDPEVEEDFVARRRRYFGYDTYNHHRKIVEAIEGTPPGGITIVILPPEAGKTTLLEDWCSDQIALDPNTRILYVSEAAAGISPAAKVLGTVKERLADATRVDPDAQHEQHLAEWHARYGPFRDPQQDKDKPWNQGFIKVHKSSGRRDYTFQATSWSSSIYGARADWLIFDDVQSQKSLDQTEKMLSRIRLTFFSRPGRKGRTVFIGTRVGVKDIYERLIEELPERMVRVVYIPAVDEHGQSYCPEMWPEDALADKRAIVGEDSWATAYMMQPQMAEATTFTEELLDRARNPLRNYGMLYTPEMSLVLAGMDPALGGGNAIIVAETTRTEFQVVAARVDYHLARNERILEILREMTRYGYQELVVERNSQQRGLARDERLRDLARIFGFKITEHETGANKWDMSWGVGAMASSFIKGEIGFPDGSEKCRKKIETLRNELLAWRPDVPTRLLRQDMVMALWFTWMIWMKRRKRPPDHRDDDRWRMKGTPWSPGDMTNRWKFTNSGVLVP